MNHDMSNIRRLLMNTIKQFTFTDPICESICKDNFDLNSDGILSELEINAVHSIGTIFESSGIFTFDELYKFEGIDSIQGKAFYNCTNLNSLKLPKNCKSLYAGSLNYNIGEGMFGNTALTEMDLTTMENISGPVISTMPLLEKVSININTVFSGAVYKNCQNLNKICITGSNNAVIDFIKKDWSNNGTWGNTRIASDHYHTLYENNEAVSNITLPEDVTQIGSCALIYTNLNSIENINNIAKIGDYAFYNCKANINGNDLTKLRSLGKFAFYGAINLNLNKIPDAVTSLDISTFENCSQLTTVDVNNLRTLNASNIFKNCTNIELDLNKLYSNSESITVYTGTFYNCRKLQVPITILEKVKELKNGCFHNCIVEAGNIVFEKLENTQAEFSANDPILKFGYASKVTFRKNKLKTIASLNGTLAKCGIIEDGGTNDINCPTRNREGCFASGDPEGPNIQLLDCASNMIEPYLCFDKCNLSNSKTSICIIRSNNVCSNFSNSLINARNSNIKKYLFVKEGLESSYVVDGCFIAAPTIPLEHIGLVVAPIGGEIWVSVMQAVAEEEGFVAAENFNWNDEFVDYEIYGGYATKPDKDENGVYKTRSHNNV